jgi:cellulose biosynthesis protein BcsQ
MGEFLGVKNSFDLYNATEDVRDIFKREAVILDKIAIHDFDPNQEHENLSPEVMAELRWLYEQEILFKPSVPLRNKGANLSEEYQEYSEGADELFDLLQELVASAEGKEMTKQQVTFF